MKILAFVDIHGNESALKRVLGKSKIADIIICAGDLTNFEQKLDQFLEKLAKTKKPVLIIPGNHETEEKLKEECKKFKSIYYIHKKKYILDDYLFFGYGSGGFEETDKELDKITRTFTKDNEKLIFVTHMPIYKTRVDFIPNIGHKGSVSARNFIEKHNPILVICGHFHETASMIDKIKETRIINPGWEGKLITLS